MSAESEAEAMAEKMKVLVKEPGKPAEVREIENTLEACQGIVEGYIEVVRITRDLLLICNEEGKIRGMKPNVFCKGDMIVGPAFFCGARLGDDGEEFRGLNEAEIDYLDKRFYLRGRAKNGKAADGEGGR